MMFIQLKNGKRIYGKDWEEVLLNLKGSTYFKQTLEEYMAGVAERAQIFSGDKIHYKDAKTFLKELERIGIITIGMRRKNNDKPI